MLTRHKKAATAAEIQQSLRTMANCTMPIFDLPPIAFKKFAIQLPTRVLEGVSAKEGTYKSGRMGTPVILTARPDGTFKIKFIADSLQSDAEATIIRDLLFRPYVQRIEIQSPVNGGQLTLSRDGGPGIAAASLKGQFHSMTIECTREAWDKTCLNEDHRKEDPCNEDQRSAWCFKLMSLFLVGALVSVTVVPLLLFPLSSGAFIERYFKIVFWIIGLILSVAMCVGIAFLLSTENKTKAPKPVAPAARS